MAQIEIPFSREMAIAAIEGRKIATTRSEKKGEVGDTFSLDNPQIPNNPARGHFRLIDIWETTLESVRDFYYHLEGCASPEEFERVWRSLHRGHFTTDKYYFIHFFARVV